MRACVWEVCAFSKRACKGKHKCVNKQPLLIQTLKAKRGFGQGLPNDYQIFMPFKTTTKTSSQVFEIVYFVNKDQQ